jgi:hypothetical protein
MTSPNGNARQAFYVSQANHAHRACFFAGQARRTMLPVKHCCAGLVVNQGRQRGRQEQSKWAMERYTTRWESYCATITATGSSIGATNTPSIARQVENYSFRRIQRRYKLAPQYHPHTRIAAPQNSVVERSCVAHFTVVVKTLPFSHHRRRQTCRTWRPTQWIDGASAVIRPPRARP